MTKGRAIFVALRLAIFAFLIALIARQLHWHDRVTVKDAAGKETVFAGTVLERDRDTITIRTVDGTLEVIEREGVVPERRPVYGLKTILRRMDSGLFALAFLCMAGTYLITTLRWYRLFRARGIDLSFREAFRLTFIGLFFNNAVPGATGGDVMKAYYAGRDRDDKAEVFASVFIDRIIGLVALVCLAGVVLVFQLGDSQFRSIARNVFLLLGVLAVGGIVYYSRRLRKLLGLSLIAHRLPFQAIFRKVDNAFFLYRFHKSTVVFSFLISFAAHSCTILCHILIGKAIGLDLSIVAYLVYVPIGQVASALPVAPGGWGVREAVYGFLFKRAGLLFQYGVALSILHGLIVTVWSLIGGVLFLAGHERLPAEPIAAMDDPPAGAGGDDPAESPEARSDDA